MKPFALLTILIFGIGVSYSQSPVWAWAKEGVTSKGASGNGIAGNGNGEVITGGAFSDTTIQFASINLVNGGAYLTDDIFLVKYGNSGNVIWAIRAGGMGGDVITDVAVDRNGNIFVTGYFDSPSLTLGSTTLTNGTGNSDVFVAKLNNSGVFQWAKSGTGNGNSEGRSIAVDSNGYVYVGGMFGGSGIQFGSQNLTNTSSTTSDLFLIQYNSSGVEQWAVNSNSIGDESIEEVSSMPAGSLAITGSYNGSTLTLGSLTLTNSGGYDAFLAIVDGSTGTFMDKLNIGSSSDEFGRSVCVGDQIEIVAAGDFSGPSLTIGSQTITNPNNGSNQVYLTHISWSNMTTLWARSFGGTSSDAVQNVFIDINDIIYVTGTYESQNLIFGQDTLSSVGGSDVYVCKWSNSGNPIWAATGGGAGYDYGLDVAVDSAGGVRASGIYSGFNVPFGAYVLNTSTYSAFTAALSSCFAPEPPICMVTVDSLSQYNIIMWDKTMYTDVDSFIIYREITTNNYQRIGSQPYSALSRFIDTVAALYFPNTGNPNSGTYRYKIQTHNPCGAYSTLGPYHNTIFMTNNNGTFSWPQLYTIEGGPNPVNAYVLLRDDNNTGNWQAINSVAGTQQSVSDPAYNAWVATANWRIKTLWSISCDPARLGGSGEFLSVNSSYSNTKLSTFGMNMENLYSQILLYPNPGNEVMHLELPDGINATVEIHSSDGKLVYSFHTLGSSINDISALSSGIYHVSVTCNNIRAVKKLVKS